MAWLEVMSALRRMLARGQMTPSRARTALDDLENLRLRRHPAAPLALRVWQLRSTHTAFDAAFVALAEGLDAPLLTTDAALSRSHGHRARIRLPG